MPWKFGELLFADPGVIESKGLRRPGGVTLSSDAEGDNRHRRQAVSASNWRSGPDYANRNLRIQKQLNQSEGFAGVSMMKSKVPGPAKPFWKNMLENEAKKLLTGQGPFLPCTRLAVSIAEGYLSSLMRMMFFSAIFPR